jgi:hypothetical protein
MIRVHCGPEAGNYLQQKTLPNPLDSAKKEITLLTSPGVNPLGEEVKVLAVCRESRNGQQSKRSTFSPESRTVRGLAKSRSFVGRRSDLLKDDNLGKDDKPGELFPVNRTPIFFDPRRMK